MLAEALLAGGRKTGAVAALANGGSIRAGLPAGNVSLGDVLTAFPFPDTLVTVNLTGADLAELLEHGLSRLGQRGGGGRFLQVAGLRYVFDPAKPEGERLVEAQIADAGGWFSPLVPETTYRVALTNYLWRGGDGFAVRAKGHGRGKGGLPAAEAILAPVRAVVRPWHGLVRDVETSRGHVFREEVEKGFAQNLLRRQADSLGPGGIDGQNAALPVDQDHPVGGGVEQGFNRAGAFGQGGLGGAVGADGASDQAQ